MNMYKFAKRLELKMKLAQVEMLQTADIETALFGVDGVKDSTELGNAVATDCDIPATTKFAITITVMPGLDLKYNVITTPNNAALNIKVAKYLTTKYKADHLNKLNTYSDNDPKKPNIKKLLKSPQTVNWFSA